MKIGIDTRMYGPKQAGLGRYVQQLIDSLLEIDEKNQFVLFMRNAKQCENAKLLGENVKLVEVDIPWYSLKEQVEMGKIIKKEKVDLMHFPHWNVPLFYNDLFVVTIHDLIMYHYPRPEATTLGPVKYWLKDRAHRIVLLHAVKKAKKIIVTSEFTRQDVHKTLGVPLEKMIVTYQAPNNKTQNTRLPEPEAQADGGQAINKTQILKKYIGNKPYVLYVGNAYPHKNLERLLKAWGIFEKKYGEGYQLVLAGRENVFYKRLKSYVLRHTPVVFAGFVPDDELSQLYFNASLYVFPSLYEGFGLPPLEAQQYGVPVVSSNASCLPEVLGESALYFDPENVEQMANAIYRGLTDENIRFELKQNAIENLKRFSSDKLERDTLGVYEDILSNC